MRTDRPNYWFPAKKIGWGGGPPCAWQGWVTLMGFIALTVVSSLTLMPAHLTAFLVCDAISLALLFVILLAKGEKLGPPSKSP